MPDIQTQSPNFIGNYLWIIKKNYVHKLRSVRPEISRLISKRNAKPVNWKKKNVWNKKIESVVILFEQIQ